MHNFQFRVVLCNRSRCMVATSRSGNGSTPFWSSQKTGCRDRGKKSQLYFLRIFI